MTKLVTFESIYPVNSIYLTIDSNFNPNISFGGSWELLPPNKCLQTTDSGGEI